MATLSEVAYEIVGGKVSPNVLMICATVSSIVLIYILYNIIFGGRTRE